MILNKLILDCWFIKSEPWFYLLSEWIMAIYEDTESCSEQQEKEPTVRQTQKTQPPMNHLKVSPMHIIIIPIKQHSLQLSIVWLKSVTWNVFWSGLFQLSGTYLLP